MKRCITTHTVTSFGEIPAGSLWDDDSPFITDDTAGHFVTVGDDAGTDPAPAKRKAPTRKFGEKKADD